MNSVRVSKHDLLEIVKKNRDGHRNIFVEAQAGFRAKVISELDRLLTAAREGKAVAAYYNLPAPVDHTKDYDRVVSMLGMSVEDVVELDAHSYESYVLDDWDWKRQFLISNSAYSEGATRALGEVG